jgi:hypothetical protein
MPVVTALVRVFTVRDVWKEWEEGIAGQPAVRVLEETWGSRWRPGNGVRVQFCRRKVIWDELLAQLLIEKGADIEAKDEEGRTPLMWAVQSWREDNAWLLLEKGANIEAKDEQGRTPLSWALRSQSEAGVRLLLEKGADIQKIICELDSFCLFADSV